MMAGFMALLAPATGAVPIPSAELLSQINRKRTDFTLASLALEPRLTAWLDLLVSSASDNPGNLTAERILDHLREHTLENVAFASVGVFRSPTRQGLAEEIRNWRDVSHADLTHAAVAGVSGNASSPYQSWVILLEQLPHFEPQLLRENAGRFHHRCAHCGHAYNGQLDGGDRILLLRCPACRSTYDILALNTRGRYERVNRFLSGIAPPTAFPSGPGKERELKTIWRLVLSHCRYVIDSDETTDAASPKDSWQTAHETFRGRAGDCEDTAILLADWLLSLGIEARVAIGATDKLSGHAWCVAKLGEEEFVLESTLESRQVGSLQTVDENAESYFPEYLFDRENLYFKKKEQSGWAKSYWSPEAWVAIPYNRPPDGEAEDMRTPSTPWIPPFPDRQTKENLVSAQDS